MKKVKKAVLIAFSVFIVGMVVINYGLNMGFAIGVIGLLLATVGRKAVLYLMRRKWGYDVKSFVIGSVSFIVSILSIYAIKHILLSVMPRFYN